MNFKFLFALLILFGETIVAQSMDLDQTEDDSFQGPINDKTTLGQKYFVNDLMSLAGYTVDEIEVYQTLPNNAKIFRVIYDEESQSGFIFIRWDKKKKENYVANKMIDPKVYYNLKKEFNIEDGALQAPDQETISSEDLEGLRLEYELQQEEKKLRELEKANKKKKRKKN
jgi:hypothetical protein